MASSSAVWNFTVDDAAAMINYVPFGDGGLDPNLSLGWFPFYNNLPATTGGESAYGESLHVTQLDGANFKIGPFYGSAIYIYGSTNATFDVDVDSQIQTRLNATSDNLLFSQTGLSTSYSHSANITVHPDAASNTLFAFDYAVVSQEMPQGQGAPIAVEYLNTNTSLNYTGEWSIVEVGVNNTQVPNTTDPLPYHQTSIAGSGVSLNFTGIGVAVNGSRDWGSWLYNVVIDGSLVDTFNASTMWLIGDSVLYFSSGLDPDVTHTINVTYAGPTEPYYFFDINSITVFKPDVPGDGITSTSNKSKTNVGAIVGVVIGGIAGLAIILGVFLFWRHRRNRRLTLEQRVPAPFPTTDAAFYSEPMVSSMKTEALASTGTLSGTRTPPLRQTPGRTYFEKERLAARQAVSPANTLRKGSASTASPPPPSTSGDSQSRSLSLAIQPPPAVPPTAPTAATPAPAAAMDVNQIIELIADRIDARGAYDRNAPPPEYPMSPQ